jgi:thioesterase domain-containing protein/acyl carrier protein
MPGPEIVFRAVYDATRFATDDIDHLLTRLITLLEAMVAAPHQPLRTLLRCGDPMPTVYSHQNNAPAQRAAFVPPRTDIEQQLVQIWQAVLGAQVIGVRDSFFELGGHSLVAIHVMAQIQQHFALRLPLSTLLQAPTVEQLAEQLKTHLAKQGAGHKVEWPTLVPIQAQGKLPPFFCVPGSGGNVLYLYELARCIGPQQPFYGLQAVGLDGETPPYTTIEAIAAHNINAIRRVQPQGPYLLGGHSFGGKVAFEMAQQLLRAGQSIAHLLLLDTAAPTRRATPDATHEDDAWWLIGLASAFSTMAGKTTGLTYAELRHLDAQQQLLCLQQELERRHFLPTPSDLKQVRGWVEVFKCNGLTNYAPSSLLPVPITLFRAAEPVTSEPAMGQPADQQQQEPTLGWAQFMQRAVEVIAVPGNHLSMMARPHVEVLAQQMWTTLSAAER